MLTDGKQEVLMHYKQADGELEIGEEVKVFVYADKEKRPTATRKDGIVTTKQAGFVEVTEVLKGVGVFVDIHTPKDILISKDYLPFDEKLWPLEGDQLLIRLKIKKDTLVGKPLNRYEIDELNENIRYADYEYREGYICRITDKGIGIVTTDYAYVFVPTHQYRGPIRLGQAVRVCITKSLEKEFYGTLNAHKEELMTTDKEILLEYMKKNHGVMYLTAKSSAEEIERIFHISRKAFKRAYGNLYKDRVIDFDDEKTYLMENLKK